MTEMADPIAMRQPAERPVLDVRNLSTTFPTRTGVVEAVKNVSFRLERGKSLCIVGESGSGKSVTARSILQILEPPGRIVGGEVWLNGKDGETRDLAALPPRGREIRDIRGSRIGMIFQEPMSSLSPLHTIGQQLVEAIRLHLPLSKAQARQRAIELLRKVEIPHPEEAIDRYTFEYSGGMRQRAMIAIALSCEPEVLIADEPTTALDVTTQAEILDLIRGLQEENGMAVMFITHDMGVVAEIADDVAVMYRGEIVEFGDVRRIFAAPRHPYTKMLLGSVLALESSRRGRGVAAAADGGDPILSVRGLGMRFTVTKGLFSRSRRDIDAVKDVTFDLARGENLGIVGESGSGKTTLGRCIMRIHEPTSGTARYFPDADAAMEITTLDDAALRDVRREIRMIFQDPFSSLNPRMTVRQIVGEPMLVNGIAKGSELDGRVAALLSDVGIDPAWMERYPHAFSGGQRQRIGIARALALDPKLIIADEATSALDVSLRTQILDLLLRIQQERDLSFIFISHDISVIRYFCDRVAVMYKGQIVEVGPTEQVCEAPNHDYTRALLSAVPRLDPTRRRIHQRHRFRETIPANSNGVAGIG